MLASMPSSFPPPAAALRALPLVLAVLISGCNVTAPTVGPAPAAAAPDTARVGRHDDGRLVTPVNQQVTPLGRVVDLPGLRPQALALAPDGSFLLVSGKTSEVLVLDPVTGEIRSRVTLPNDKQAEPHPAAASANFLDPDRKGQASFTGLVFSPDGRRVYLSNVNGSIKVFAVGPGGEVSPSHSIPLPPADAPRRKEEIPSGLAVSRDGTLLYVCGNLSNSLLEIETATGRVRRTFDVGVAPYDVVLAGDRAYVSNWGGRRPGPGDLTGPAGRGTVVRIDPETHAASEGSVSIVPLTAAAGSPAEIVTGRNASALALAPDGRHLVCANAGADHLSVIDTRTGAKVETIWCKPSPADLLGSSPNALAFDPSGRRLYVANGAQNAVAVIRFDPADRESRLLGLLPVGWYPGALILDPRRGTLAVGNLKGLPDKPQRASGTAGSGFNSRQFSGSLTLTRIPADAELPALSETVARNLRREAIREALLPPRPGITPRAIPERIGEPSRIRHVVYVIKENRTYDQVFGALGRGNGDPSLAVFGERFTPNQHKLVRDFVLLDNTYCSGILSADGHQWSTTAFSTDYMEKSFAGFPRSYPDGMSVDGADALAYSPAGFIWDSARRRGVSVRNYGEFMIPDVRWRDGRKGTPDFLACYRTWRGQSDEVIFASRPALESIRPFSPTGYVGWEMSVPDQARADFFIRELREFEARREFPGLTLICLPNDHTSGTKPGTPTPGACMADNDLAFGRIVEALSRSRFWPEMAILAIEDDPQNGWDHVSGYRTTAYCISPWARRGAIVSTRYNTTSLLRTIGQILGLPPMNQFDASATPMTDCFTDTPDFTPFTAVPANIRLDEMNPPAKAISEPALRRDALASEAMNFREVDKAPEDALNRILWRAMKGPRAPYPEWAVTPDTDD